MNETAYTYTIDVEVEEAFKSEIDAEELIDVIKETLHQQNVPAASLTLSIVDDETVRSLNRQYRCVDATTDVLSFASHEEDASNAADFVLPPELAAEMAAYLGDIVIAFPYAKGQAARYGNSVAAEMRLLAVHGTLHLLGYDHDSPHSESAMWAAQDAVLSRYGDSELTYRSYDA